MVLPLCNGCRERDVLIASLQARVAQLEADAARQQQTTQRLQATVDRLTQRLAQYEPEVKQEARPGSGSGETPATSYSLDAEEKRRRRKRRRKQSPGRQLTLLKFAEVERVEDIYPEGVVRSDCHLARERAVWRLENGRAVRAGYRVFAGPDGTEPRIPGVTLRCEYGIEILVVLAFLVYVIGISLDKACAVLAFFCRF